jgi:translation initiation factor IF-3
LAKTTCGQGGVAINFDRKPRERGDSTRINERIVAREVRVIGEDGEQLGIMPTDDAIRMAEERGMDLVEVSPTSRPPVCRVMDYGKYKYSQKKKAQSAKKKAIAQSVKEVKLRPKTEEHDYQFKLKHITRFLIEGAKAKVTVRFRGREMAHRDIGFEMLQRIIQDAGELASVSSPPMMEGRLLYMVLAPSPKAMVIMRAKEEERNRARALKEKEEGKAPKERAPESDRMLDEPEEAEVSD